MPLTSSERPLADHDKDKDQLLEELIELRRRVAHLSETEERYRTLFENAAEGLFLSTPGGRLLLGNMALVEMFGYHSWREASVHASTLAGLLFTDREDYDRLAETMAENGHVEGFEARSARIDTTHFWISTNVRVIKDRDGQPIVWQGSVMDVTHKKSVEERLLSEGFHDPITGLVNRSMFLTQLEQAVARARRREEFAFALVSLDIDRFRMVNESLGNKVGDQVLVRVSEILLDALRTEDSCARLGADEFALLLSDVSKTADALRVINRVNRTLEKPLIVEEHEIFTSVSAGVVLMTGREYTSSEDMLRDADTAMYRAKSDSSLSFAVFNEAMQREAMERLTVETDLRRAQERNEFRLHYQPIVSVRTGQVHGFEALIRWQRPGLGLVPPFAFVPLLEETGLIVPVGLWVLEEACRTALGWQKRFGNHRDLLASINVSAKQLESPGFVDTVRRVLADTGVRPETIKLEITESVVMENPAVAETLLGELKGLGVSLSIDDFGTGYSSLASLHRFPVDVLKVDKSFITAMHEPGDQGTEIVQAIMVLAHHLGKEVIAEGVETARQLSQLMSMECEYIQGYYFSQPVPDNEFAGLLERGFGEG